MGPPDENPYFSSTSRHHSRPAGPGAAATAAAAGNPPPPPQPPSSRARNVLFRPMERQQSSVRLRRLRAPIGAPEEAAAGLRQVQTQVQSQTIPEEPEPLHHHRPGGRRRSSSDPRPSAGSRSVVVVDHAAAAATMKPLPPLPEQTSTPADTNVFDFQPEHPTHPTQVQQQQEEEKIPEGEGRLGRRGGFGSFGSFGSLKGLRRRRHDAAQSRAEAAESDECYDSRIVDLLDVIDPEVSTLSSITNVQNSLFVPSLGRWVDRRPTYDLSDYPTLPGAYPPSQEDVSGGPPPAGGPEKEGGDEEEGGGGGGDERPGLGRTHSLSTVLTAPQYAVLPDDATLDGWTAQDIKLLNDHVRHMLHSRRSKMKQRLRAFGKYVRRPLGFLITLYATLITLFGLAWVLFLIGWIYVGDRQLYIINVIDNVLVALFAVVGDGLAPFRAVDTYHMIFVAHYHCKTWKLRKKLLLADLEDHNDLPTEGAFTDASDLEAALRSSQQSSSTTTTTTTTEKKPAPPLTLDSIAVLPPAQQARLVHHQQKLAKSHTFYKPHETDTHRAFPLRLLIAVVCLLDLHSCLQISLGACTWAIDWRTRSMALTTTILCCSITANCTAGVLIAIGDRRTRKRDVIERMTKQDLTAQAMDAVRRDRRRVEERKARRSEDREGLRGEEGAGEPRKSRERAGRFDVVSRWPAVGGGHGHGQAASPSSGRGSGDSERGPAVVPGEFPAGV